jgi:hypothetical protein
MEKILNFVKNRKFEWKLMKKWSKIAKKLKKTVKIMKNRVVRHRVPPCWVGQFCYIMKPSGGYVRDKKWSGSYAMENDRGAM